jgi:hypothetical protein
MPGDNSGMRAYMENQGAMSEEEAVQMAYAQSLRCVYECESTFVCAWVYMRAYMENQGAMSEAVQMAYAQSLRCVYMCMWRYLCVCLGVYAFFRLI